MEKVKSDYIKNVIVILDYNGVLVGFFVLEMGDRVKEFIDNEDVLFLMLFFINYNR